MHAHERVNAVVEVAETFRAAVRVLSAGPAGEARALLDALEALPDRELPAVDGRWRSNWYQRPAATRRHLWLLRSARNQDVRRAAGVVCSWDRDGHLRETAVGVLAGELPWSAPHLVVRAVDHVDEVRERALRALRGAPPSALVDVLGLVVALERRFRGDALQALVAESLTPDALRAGVRHPDRFVRRACWRRLGPEGAPLEVALADADTGVRLWAAAQAVRLEPDDRVRYAEALSSDPLPRLRGLGLQIAIAAGAADRGRLERASADRSAAVRAMAHDALLALDVDPAERHRARLPAPEHVLGLAETGSADDVPAFLAIAREPGATPRSQAAAIHAVATLDRPRGIALALDALEDPAPGVALSAARVLRASHPGDVALDRLLERVTAVQPVSVRIQALAALRWSPWRALVAGCRLLSDERPAVHAASRRAIARAATHSLPPGRVAAHRAEIERAADLVDPRLARDLRFLLR